MTKILLVEDDTDYAELLTISLNKAGWDIDLAGSIKEAQYRKQTGIYDLILLDVMLPDGNGYDFCKEFFEEYPNIPIVMVSAIRQSEEDKILGLECGAIDYVLKSHSHKELIARIKRILAKPPSELDSERYTLKISEDLVFTFDVFHQQVFVNNKKLPLTNIEFQLFYIFAKNLNKPLMRNAILKKVWEFEPKESQTLKVHLYRLRHKLFKYTPTREVDIQSVRRAGYMLSTKRYLKMG